MANNRLVVCEKPSVAKSIAAVLGAEKREDGYRIWYSCDKDAPGQSYSAGRIYCADFEEDLTCRAKDEALIKRQSEYDGIGGVRLYDVRQIDGKNYYLYARNYLTDNELRIIIK